LLVVALKWCVHRHGKAAQAAQAGDVVAIALTKILLVLHPPQHLPHAVTAQVGQPAHLGAARQLKECYSTFEKIKELIPLGGYTPGADIKTDRAVQLAPTIERFLRQDVGEAAELETSVATLQNILGKPR
jgi:hypothetical protein